MKVMNFLQSALVAGLLAIAGAASALHASPVRVSLDEGIQVDPPVETLEHAVGSAAALAASAVERPAAPEPGPARTEASPSPAPRDGPTSASALTLLVLVGVALVAMGALAWRALRRRRAEKTDGWREKARLSRLCAEASVRRAVALQEQNERLRGERDALLAQRAKPA